MPDSRTTSRIWRAIVRQVREDGRANDTPCHLCGGALGPIDYRTKAEADRDARHRGAYWEIGARRPLALHVDHVVPHAAGGSDDITNTAPSHAVCNERAGAKRQTQATPRTPRQQPVNGVWIPKTGTAAPLPGRALPGAQTATHRFEAGAHRFEAGAHPLPAPARVATRRTGDTPGRATPPRR